MKSKIITVAIHITCCVSFLALPILFAPDEPIYWFQFNSYALHQLLLYSLFICFFYFNTFVLIPRLYFTRKFFFFALTCVACFFIITLVPNILTPGTDFEVARHISPPPGAAPPFFADVEQTHFQKPFMLPHINDNFFIFMVVLFISMTLKINNQWKRTEKEKTEAQLSYLQSQINPHFLFNTLNSIYSLALEEKSKNTATAVVKLSGLMRYITTEAGNDFVPLDKEINYITNYVELQMLRLGNTVEVRYDTSGSYIGKKITPLLLIPFIENAFKHGVNAEEHSYIEINIEVKDYDLYLKVLNNKVKILSTEQKSHVGIQNTKDRLSILYPGRHTLTIEDEKTTYQVNLKINLT